jgi:DNA-binding transcriptional MerR regulator
MTNKSDLSPEGIAKLILTFRGQKVMLDADLAKLYGVKTSNLNKAVKRNSNRFPGDFVFQLTTEEASALRFQNGISKAARRGGRRYLAYVFTEQGVAMLSSVLRSRRAVEVNIEIMRAFVRLRQFLSAHRELAQKLAQLERKIGAHDEQIKAIFDAIRQLMAPPEPSKRKIGFLVKERAASYGKR